jgi:hypothetical protein
MRRSSLFWGVVLILLGAVWLLDNLNILPFRLWPTFWPLLLILAGGWMLLGAFGRRPVEAETASLPLDGAAQARLRIGHGAGRLEAGAGAAPGDLLSGTFEGGLDKRVQRAGDALEVELSQPERNWMWGPWDWSRGLNWSLRLSPAVPLALELNTGAGEARLDLRDLRVTELRLKTGASSTEITLPAAAGHTTVRVEAGAASVVLRVPDGVAAKISAVAGAGAVDVDQRRFPGNQSPDFATAANRVEIDARLGAGSLSVR